MSSSRSVGLEAVVYYKFFIAGLLTATSIALFSTSYNPAKLEIIAESGLFETHFWLIDQGLDRFLNIDPKSMQLGGVATGLYAALVLVQAIGLWQNRAWAKGLVLITAGMSLPVEVYELGHKFTLLKLVLLIVNLLLFSYLWNHLKLNHRWQYRQVSER